MFNLLLGAFWFVIGVALLVLYYTTPNPQWPIQVNGYPLGWVPLLLSGWNLVRWYAVRVDRQRRQAQAEMQVRRRYAATGRHEPYGDPDPAFDFTDEPPPPRGRDVQPPPN